MTRRKQKIEIEEVAEDEVVVDTSNDLNEIKTLLKTVVKPTEVNNNDVMLPRSASRYVPPLR